MIAVESPSLDPTSMNESSKLLLNIPPQSEHEQYRDKVLISHLLADEIVRFSSQTSEFRDLSALLSLHIDNLHQIERGASYTEFVSSINLVDDLLFDEPLPRIPRSVQTIHGKLRLVQRRKPNLLTETEIGAFEDNV